MKHLKKFNEIFAYGNQEMEDLSKLLRELNIDFTVGTDHLGNDNVFLFNKDGFDFEVYDIPSGTYHVNYGKDGNWIKNFNTHDIKKDILEILGSESVTEKNWIKDAIKRPGALRKKLGKKKGEKISKGEIRSEISDLKSKDKDPKKAGVQGLSKSDLTKLRQLNLAKTLKGMK